jgi:hypothetical protein
MAAKRKKLKKATVPKKPIQKKSAMRITSLRLVANKKSLNGFGALEPIDVAYFSTVFRLVTNKSSYCAKPNAALDPAEFIANASQIAVKPGVSISIEGETFLVARGRNHSLLISSVEDLDQLFLESMPYGKTLTLGLLYEQLQELSKMGLNVEVFVTKSLPMPIAWSETRKWGLILGSGGSRGWKLSSSNFIKLEVSRGELLLHAYINRPNHVWMTDDSSSEMIEGIARQIDISKIDLSNQIMKNANLSSANLSHADLCFANLSHADLSFAELPNGVVRIR